MFQPETEDMLPRMAPKPSGAVPSGIIKPQVPEVSILFGQQDPVISQQSLNIGLQQQPLKKNVPQQTYESWKKQMLPKVNYPSVPHLVDSQTQEHTNKNININDYNTARTNLYPLRTTSVLNIASNMNANGFDKPMTYRRSLEGCTNNMLFQQMQHLSPVSNQPPVANLSVPIANSRDVLTICAGTQTDAIFESSNYQQCIPLSNLATKEDVNDIRQMLDEMCYEQQNIAKMLTTLLQQIPVKSPSRDIGLQVEIVEKEVIPYMNGDMALKNEHQSDLQQAPPINKFLQNLKPANNILQTPKGKPIAQSTTYRTNSPDTQRLKNDLPEVSSAPKYHQLNGNSINAMPKSASDTSLAMNELALKYLPNEKLAELLKELNMDDRDVVVRYVPTTPERENGDKFVKGPSDISNASYKYLKKYRLLPEESAADDDSNNNNKNIFRGESDREIQNVNENQMASYNSPHYNNIRKTPINQRHTPTNKCLPYAGHLPLSPLARSSTPPQTSPVTQQHIVNLENIKHQPKFL